MLMVINTKPLTNGGDIDRLTRFTEYFVAARHQPQIITVVLRERQIRSLIININQYAWSLKYCIHYMDPRKSSCGIVTANGDPNKVTMIDLWKVHKLNKI